MAFIIPRNPTLLESLGQGVQAALPGLVAGAQQRTQQQALQTAGQQFGLNLPQGINPQLANLLIGQAQQASLDPRSAASGFTLSQGQQRFDVAGNPIASVGGGGFTLGQGQQRFDELGRPIAGVAPPKQQPRLRAGALQVAGENDPSGFSAGTVFQADPQGNIKIISETGGEGLSAKEKVNLAVNQSKEFLADKRIQDFQEIERGARGIVKAFDRSIASGKKGPTDQALGVLFQKMLDPGSVVRESEFARTSAGQGAVDKLIGGVQKIVTGGIGLTQGERKELMEVAKLLLNESKVTFNKTFEEFSTRADEIGLNKRIVFGGAKPFDVTEQAATGQNQQFQVGQTIINNGQPFTITGFDTDGTPLGEPAR